MKTLMLAVAACAAFTVTAETKKTGTVDPKTVAEYHARMLRITGGDVTRPGKGFVAILNRQTKLPAKELDAAARKLIEESRINVRVVAEESEAKGAGLVIRIIDESGKPPLLVAPEEWWAEVNVAALGSDLKGETALAKFVPSRLRKEVMRAFAYAAGAGGSGFGGNILDTTCVRDLDYREEFIPADALDLSLTHLESRGVTRAETVTYRNACQEGWAPAPTNDIQKAIWEKVHNPPTKPLKITYDKAAQKPVVK